jgi:hypothetical protein
MSSTTRMPVSEAVVPCAVRPESVVTPTMTASRNLSPPA